MLGSGKRVARRLASVAIVLALLALALAGRAGAQIVTNGDFKIPNVASAPNGFLGVGAPALLNTPGVGWTFPVGAARNSGITAERVTSGAGLDAPEAPDSPQVGFISTLGQINQLLTLGPGSYTLSFKLAATDANQVIPVQVYLDQQLGTFSPTSTTSYKEFTVPFTIGAAGPYVLRFVGEDSNSLGMTFIDGVSITEEPPVITAGPSDIDPTSKIPLSGRNFSLPLQVSVAFTTPSTTPPFGMTLNVPPGHASADLKSILTEAIDATYPTGKENEQTVDITVATPYAKLPSNTWHATFHPNAVITSGPATITPGQKFTLTGWNFDSTQECAANSQDRGTVTIHFPHKSVVKFANQGNNASYSDLVIQIPYKDDGCLTDAVKVEVQSNTVGVIEQQVEITYESPKGRKSNAWSANFKPTMVMDPVPAYNILVIQCSNQSGLDLCNPTLENSGSSAGGVGCLNTLGGGGPQLGDSILALHFSCWSLTSDNGEDVYSVIVPPPWAITKILYTMSSPPLPEGVWGSAGTDSTMEYVLTPSAFQTTNSLFVTVHWHIGHDGGIVLYAFDAYMEGPAGVPAQ